MSKDDRREVDGRRGVGVPGSRLAPERPGRVGPSLVLDVLLPEGNRIGGRQRPVRSGGIDIAFLSEDMDGIVAANAGCHRQELPQRDIRFALIAQRKRLGWKIVRCEDLLVQAVREAVRALPQENADRDTREAIPPLYTRPA